MSERNEPIGAGEPSDEWGPHMSGKLPVFNRQISAGSALLIFLQLGGLGLLGSVASYFESQRASLQKIELNQNEAAQKLDAAYSKISELFHRQDATEGENNLWRRQVTESLDEYRHRLDRLDWMSMGHPYDGDRVAPAKRR